LETAWEGAVTRGDVATVRALLRAGAEVDARDRHGQTALMLAAHRGYREMVEILVEGGADLNVTAKFSLSALMLAITAGHAEVARVLARAGADLRVTGSGAPGFAGKTAHDLAVGLGMEDLYAELRPG
jgi:ankyrin repeat protein